MNHIIIEGNCFYNSDKKKYEAAPECCKFGPNNISINCLKFNEGTNQYCPFLVFGSTRTALVLTDPNGITTNSSSYWGDLKLSDEEWVIKEKEWMEKQNSYINKINGDKELES